MWEIVTSAVYHPYVYMCMHMHMYMYGKNIYMSADKHPHHRGGDNQPTIFSVSGVVIFEQGSRILRVTDPQKLTLIPY